MKISRHSADPRSMDRRTAFEPTLDASPSPDLRTTMDAEAGTPSISPPVEAELPPERYHLREAIGAGGMGEVRVLEDGWIGRDVARKAMRREIAGSGAARARFLREIRVQGQLEHPSIVPVYDVGTTGEGELYFTMRKIQGRTLADVIDGLTRSDADLTARFSRRKLLTAFSSVAMAVHYAHSRGVVHRDLKPQNIMLGAYGEVYVLDWGIAKLREGGGALEEAGRIVGTLGYMAPEQARGESEEVDPRADVYALGVILFEILAGEHVLAGLDEAAVMAALAGGVDARPTTRRRGADVPPELEEICVRATAARPDDRFPSAAALSEAVERYLDGDRDLERRRELAEGYAKEAEAHAERAFAAETPRDEAEAARAGAVREVFHALALSPEQSDAQRTLARLLLDVPRELPPAAAAERELAKREERAAAAGLGFKAFASYLLTFPLMLLIGVRSWLLVGGGMLVTVLTALAARWAHKTRKVGTATFAAILVMAFLVIIIHGTWLGPFVLLPTSATITTSVFALHAERRERALVLAAGAAMFLLPFLAELLGLVPPGFSFEPGRVILHERALALPATMTTVALVYTSVSYIVLPGLFLFRVRDSLQSAEDRRFYQAWTMRQLFPVKPS
jgi:serine/threonine-protein kinase